jgi:hypothetical protein
MIVDENERAARSEYRRILVVNSRCCGTALWIDVVRCR